MAILLFAAFATAETTTVAPVETSAVTPAADSLDSAATTSIQELKKKHAVWIKLEGDVEPSMYDFCARAIDDALKEKARLHRF